MTDLILANVKKELQIKIKKRLQKSSELPRSSRRLQKLVPKNNIKFSRKEESGSSINTFSNSPSEFMTDSGDEMKQDDEASNKVMNDIVELLTDVFPLTINKEDIMLNQDQIQDKTNLKRREITFIGKYKQVDILCLCVLRYGDAKYCQDKYYYGCQMSEELLSCRNMASYFGIFEANVSDIVNSLYNAPKKPALFIAKPFFLNGTLAHYLKLKRKTDTYLEPLYMMQMAISLFSILSDAHDQNMGLVDITLGSLFVGADNGLYFSGFQSCLHLDETVPTHDKPWMDLKMVKCPEAKQLKGSTYKKSADVFLATTIILELTRSFKQSATKRLYIQNNHLKKVTVNQEIVDERHENMIHIIEQGLKYNPEERPSASTMLSWLETIRYKSIADL